MKFFFLLTAFLLSACASTRMNSKSDYQAAQDLVKKDDPQKAMEALPKKEEGGFISDLEKSYLSLISSEPPLKEEELKHLVDLSRSWTNKETLVVSDELQNYFYIESDDGYFPAEHEVLWMHVILGLNFAKNNQPDQARVEAKKISEIYSRISVNGRQFFDDAIFRVLSATLWIYVGEWDQAQVDLRRAAQLDPRLKSLADIAKKPKAPENWDVYLVGSGGEVSFKPKSVDAKIFGYDGLLFTQARALSDGTQWGDEWLRLGSTSSWYDRHVHRNQMLKDVINKSKYMAGMFRSELEYHAVEASNIAISGTVIVMGITLGVAIVGGGLYLAANAGASAGSGDAIGYIIGGGFVIGAYIVNSGIDYYKRVHAEISKSREESEDLSRLYRYVRFLPESFYLGVGDTSSALRAPCLSLEALKSKTKIHLYWRP